MERSLLSKWLIYKLDYDEEDHGFPFKRTRSKRAKAMPPVQVPDPLAEKVQEGVARLVVGKKSRKKPVEPSIVLQVSEVTTQSKRRRSPRNSGDSNLVEPLPVEVKKKRPKQTDAEKTKSGRESETTETRDLVATKDSVDQVGLAKAQVHLRDPSKDVTKIALPFADTPIIRRNKEMRKGAGDGSRRSSLGMRGRRASSLIDGGKSNGMAQV